MEKIDAFEEIVENFAFLDDWDERYRYIIELGREMPALAPNDQIDSNKVDGCVSQVWLVSCIETDEAGRRRMYFEGNSDAHITRGLIAILRALFSGMTLEDIARTDAASALARLDLSAHISPQRSNGLRAMVRRVQGTAASS